MGITSYIPANYAKIQFRPSQIKSPISGSYLTVSWIQSETLMVTNQITCLKGPFHHKRALANTNAIQSKCPPKMSIKAKDTFPVSVSCDPSWLCWLAEGSQRGGESVIGFFNPQNLNWSCPLVQHHHDIYWGTSAVHRKLWSWTPVDCSFHSIVMKYINIVQNQSKFWL